MPPSSAMLMAMRLSVTVSIGELTTGAFRLIPRVSRVSREMSARAQLMKPGSRMKSS